MFIADLFENYVAEAGPELVVLYPGRFQPFHLGHGEVFRDLQSKFGRDNVYIATSNKVELPKSPFNFSEKIQFMHAVGVPGDRIIEVTSPYKLPEPQFNPANTIFIVAVGAPDRDRLRPDSVKKDGNPGYYKTFESLDKCQTADKHGYVIIADERQKVITINGQSVDVSHGTPARAAWNAVRDNPKSRSEYLLQMFGRDDAELGRILDKIPQTVNEQMFSESMIDDTQTVTPLQKQLGSLSAELDKHERYNTGKYPAGRDNVIGAKQPWDTKTVDMPGDFKSHVHDTELGNKIKNNPATAKMNDPMVKWGGENYGLESEVKKRARERYYETAGVGVIANKKQAKDPRYSHSLTSDIRPGEVGRQLKKMHLADSVQKLQEQVASLKEKWSTKYKRSINCNNPRGFSQRAHCQGRKK
jgi:hypothetical protein